MLDHLKAAFNPQGVAVVGASNDIQKFGGIFTESLKSAHFAHIYPVNPKEREIMGLQAYPSVKDIPGPCDYAIISVPAEKIPNVIKDCAVKGVKTVSIFTAGFGESGGKEGKRKEKKIVEVAHQGNIRVIGPNCLGAFCPEVGLTPFLASGGSGGFGFISQSGGHMEEFCRLGKKYGIGMSKGVSYGNASDLDSTDFIEYLEEDPQTKVIGLYIEGVKEGSRFLKVVRRASSKKPIIIWKGGTTEAGTRAAASHTGSLTGSQVIWDSLFKQTGAIKVNDLTELLDTALAFLYLPLLKGKNVALIGAGGGASVSGVDDVERSRLTVPPFSPPMREELEGLIPPLGTSMRNPVDLSYFLMLDPGLMVKTVNLAARDPRIDSLIVFYWPDSVVPAFYAASQVVEGIGKELEIIQGVFKKPLIAVLYESTSGEDEQHLFGKIPVYPTVARAARALFNLAARSEYLQRFSDRAKFEI